MSKPRCESCGNPSDTVEENENEEIICSSCMSNRTEAAYERHQESLMDGSTPTFHETYLKAWQQKQELKRR